MESSTKKYEVVDIPRRNRSLDLKSLYESRVSRVRDTKKNVSEDNGYEDAKKKKRKSRKEVPLSCFQSDSKKTRKEEVNGVELEIGFGQKSSGRREGLHGISLTFVESGSAFIIPKRPRGSVGRKKLECDQVHGPLKFPSSVDNVEAVKTKLTDSAEKACPNDKLVRLDTLSAVNYGVPSLQSTGKVCDSISKAKQKIDLKSTVNINSSNAKLKQKVEVDEVKENRSGHSVSIGHEVKEENPEETLTKKADSKIRVKSSRSNLNSKRKRKVGVDELKEKRNLVLASDGSLMKEYDPESKSKKVEFKSSVNASGTHSKLKVKVGSEVVAKVDDQPAPVQDECSLAVDDGDASIKKRQRRSRKKKDLVFVRDCGDTLKKKSEPSGSNSVSNKHFVDFLGDDDDDEEENLEKNAAQMLSSRFDPSCTGFSLKRRPSASQRADGLSFPISSTRELFGTHPISLGGVESASADDKSRALRPRREDKGKGLTRKRRHFYEIPPGDLEPYWVLNQRIKIFWPLDESWYYGLVNDYDSESQLHHIKYDDRDEEWLDLQEEKFKLLLLPSEAPGRSKSRKRSTRKNDSQSWQTVQQSDDNSFMENSLDSEPIASWLASQSQRVKALPKSVRRQRTSLENQPLGSLSSVKAGYPSREFSDLNAVGNKLDSDSAQEEYVRNYGTADKSLLFGGSQSGKNVVYVRKRYHKKSLGGSSPARNFKSCGNAPWTVTPLAKLTDGLMTRKEVEHFGWMDLKKQLWSFDNRGIIRLHDILLEFKDSRFEMYLPALPALGFAHEMGTLVHDTFMLQHGVVVTTSPAVLLEMLFIDNNLGLKFLFYEGCMRKAITFVSLILIVFSQSNGHLNGEMRLPVTSIKFRISSAQDLRKRLVFACYSFSRLRSTKWLYLDSKVLQHCLVLKQLSVSECTYDKIKELECGNFQQCKPRANQYSGSWKKLVPGILPIGISREAHNSRMCLSAYLLSAKPGKAPHFALSFTAAPTFFLTLHLQMLMESSFAWANLHNPDSVCSPESSENGGEQVAQRAEYGPDLGALKDIAIQHEIRIFESGTPASGGLPSYQQLDITVAGNASKNSNSSKKLQKWNMEVDRVPGCSNDFTESTPGVVSQSSELEPMNRETFARIPSSETMALTSKSSNSRIESRSSDLLIGIPSFDGKICVSGQISDVGWNLHEDFLHNSSPAWKRGIGSSISSPIGQHSLWSDGNPNIMHSGFSNGPKKPRTQVQYTLPFAGYDFSSKHKTPSSRSLPCKRIRRASLKRISDGPGNNQKNLELQTCNVNILVTHADKGWRECGAQVVLEVADHNEWKLAVKLSGLTKYSYKVKHILQPGTTNRYSHSMMWKGGKDWVLEFPDRSQWMLFKEMHEECYNRNIRAASMKNIPIPGVRLVEESEEYGTDVPFARNSTRYIRQVQSDVEMAMDPSRILYDMDSDDEQCLMESSNTTDKCKCEEISEEFLEKVMDMFEKISYAQHRESFTDAEIEELVVGIGSFLAGKIVYEHWRHKREKMGMPLVRQLQPPLWERYQQQLKEWERTVVRANPVVSDEDHERLSPPEKPPMFAFCLKPRGLEVPNKGSKQRSHRKLPVSGYHYASSGNHDSLHLFGRRSNGHAFIDEKMLHASSVNYSSDVSPSLLASTRVLYPQDAHFSLSIDASEWRVNPTFDKNRPKKLVTYPALHNQRMIPLNTMRTSGQNGVQPWDGPPELSLPKNYYFGGHHDQTGKHLYSSELHEFHLRDASGTATHARSLAKLKKLKAQRLFCKADLAIHKAVVALLTAEAIRDSSEEHSDDQQLE